MSGFESFNVGQRAWVFSSDGAGNMVVEGECVVMQVINAASGRYLVNLGAGQTVERFLQKEGQHDPHGFVRWLNDPDIEGDYHAS